MTKADDRIIRVGDAYDYWKQKAQSVTDLNNAKILRNMLDEVPSAQKNGKWIISQNGWIYCSECEWMPDWGEMGKEEFRYCPNCGASMMRGDTDDKE